MGAFVLMVASILVVSWAMGSEYDYNSNHFYRDDYLNDGYTIHGDYPRDWNPDWGRVQRPKCIDIPQNLTLCQDIGYQSMRLPNLLDHDTLSEVTQQARSWVPLLGIHCHPDAKLFLCSLFSPVCLERTIWPCRSLCESVKNACIARMRYYKFDWPEMLRCDKFPVDNDLCIKQQNYYKPQCTGNDCNIQGNSSTTIIADKNCTACRQPRTYEAIVDNYCRSQFVLRAGVKEVQKIINKSLVILKRKKKFYKRDVIMSEKTERDLALVIDGDSHCSCDFLGDTKSKFLLMGNKTGNDFKLTFVIPWERKIPRYKKALKKALRKVIKNVAKRSGTCSQLFNHEMVSGTASPLDKLMPTKPSKPTKNRKGKGRKNKKKKNRRRKKKKKKNKKKRKKDRKSKKRRRPRKERRRKVESNQVGNNFSPRV